ncbi:MAG TPA: cytochrome c [Terracidiphilus sp.]|jgi:mono/diheme cytochrome c family protein|nr:cytochrome c [Terracidiphilus sp.]
MTRRFFAILCLMASASLLLCAAASSRLDRVPARDHDRINPLATQPESVAAGSLVYRDHCAQCHRADAKGDGRKKPPLRSDHLKLATDGDLEWFLRQGDLAHGMPSWSSLPEAQRWQLITYLRSIQ